MTTISLNDSTRAILAQVRAAIKAATDASALNHQVYERDGAKMTAAYHAWRARNPNSFAKAADKDPEVLAAGAEYERTLQASYALADIRGDLGVKLATEVAALVKARAQQIGDYRLPVFTYQKRPVGFRYLVDGAKARDSKRGQAYTALFARLSATVTEDGITDVVWQHTDEYSATPNRLRAKCLKTIPHVYSGWSSSDKEGTPVKLWCAATVLLARVEAQA
jgi:hypothetical protein